MCYADADFYVNEYLSGKREVVPSDEFEYWARRASGYIDALTFGRVDAEEVPDCVKYCACELAEFFFTEDKNRSADTLRSVSVGGFSQSFSDKSVKSEDRRSALRELISRWIPPGDPLRSKEVV